MHKKPSEPTQAELTSNSHIREQLRFIENEREKQRPHSDTIDAQLFYRQQHR